jgi:hypothetical protein
MKITTIFLTIFTIFGVIIYCSYFKPSLEEDEKLVNLITAKTAKKLEKEKELILIGTGGRMMNDVEMLMMGFQYHTAVDIKTVRKLLIDSVEEYLSEINANEKLRPYLHNYPFTTKNLEIVIYFRNPDGSKVAPDQINVASAQEGNMFYYIDYPEKYTLKAICEETYEEALQSVSFKKGS